MYLLDLSGMLLLSLLLVQLLLHCRCGCCIGCFVCCWFGCKSIEDIRVLSVWQVRWAMAKVSEGVSHIAYSEGGTCWLVVRWTLSVTLVVELYEVQIQ